MNQSNLHTPHVLDIHSLQPGFSIDCVIYSFYKKKIRVLLNKFAFSEYWQLPGGFLYKDESVEETSKRILQRRTGITDLYLKQFHLFSDPHRISKDQNTEYAEALGDVDETKQWLLQRFVTLGYHAFVKYDQVKLSTSEQEAVQWFAINDLPALYSDHGNIIKTSLECIRSTLPIVPVGYELLPKKFAMSELRKIYEIFLDKTIDRRNFQRKVMSSDVIVQLDETKNDSPYNPPILYSFKEGKMDLGDFWIF